MQGPAKLCSGALERQGFSSSEVQDAKDHANLMLLGLTSLSEEGPETDPHKKNEKPRQRQTDKMIPGDIV